jgi:DNA polymerase-3 subunit delta'
VPGFDAIIDQERPIRILTSLLLHGTIPHALLFSGIEGVGKKTAAMALAMACNCTAGEDRGGSASKSPAQAGGRLQDMPAAAAGPCGRCGACRRIARGIHPDVLRIAPAGTVIKIDQIRELAQFLALKPYAGRTRVVLIADAQALNIAAGNALLKMLEEPPERNVLILTTARASDLLPTIVSRCQHIRFKPLARRHLAAILERAYGFGAEEAALTAALAGGSVTRALSLKRSDWLNRRSWLMAELFELKHRPPSQLLALAERLSRDKQDLPLALELIANWLRDLAVAPHARERLLNADWGEAIAGASQASGLERLVSAMGALHETRQRLQANANPRLALEALFLTIASDVAAPGRPG